MMRNWNGATGPAAMAAALALGALAVGTSGQAATYPTMGPLAPYLMDRNAEIALARSAAPPAISDDATIMVLGRGGYETAARGKNGFVCLVERGWMSPFDAPDFWNPRLRGPVCYNPPAARSLMPRTVKRTALALTGQSKDAMLAALKTAVAKQELAPPAPGAMSYMMSKQQYLGDAGGSWMPHLMFHVPPADAASWGANLSGSPIMLDTDHAAGPEPETIFMVAAGKWSDGTPYVHDETHKH
jgi:hypothetical protein